MNKLGEGVHCHLVSIGVPAAATKSADSEPPVSRVGTEKLQLTAAESRRVTQALNSDFRAIFRVGRRLGLTPAVAEEAVQEAFLVFSQRIRQIEAGKERAFLLGTITRLAANLRRAAHRRNEVPIDPSWSEVERFELSAASLLDDHQARDLLDCVLAKLTPELREVFVLYEIEQLTMSEVADSLGIKLGTVGSRLHRARQAFDSAMRRVDKDSIPVRSTNERA
ncbi:MAG TPA: RNA polymerase sigma factor [Polyangiaceae bacterium]|nr:RNA polymerase sigma factor [Polyangiaceae bacterium]